MAPMHNSNTHAQISYIHTYKYIYTYIHTYTYTCVHTSTCTYMAPMHNSNTHAQISSSICLQIGKLLKKQGISDDPKGELVTNGRKKTSCLCIYVHIHIYIYIYMHICFGIFPCSVGALFFLWSLRFGMNRIAVYYKGVYFEEVIRASDFFRAVLGLCSFFDPSVWERSYTDERAEQVVYLCIYVCVCICMYIYIYIYICMHVCMYVCMYVCVYICIYIYIYIYVYVYIYIYVYTYVCMHVYKGA
jgi:hypothetical protein